MNVFRRQLICLLLLQISASTYSFLTATNKQSFTATRGGAIGRSSPLEMAASSKPFAVVVQAEVKPDRMDEFLEMIKNNAENSRKEPGCIRFGT